MCVQVFDTHWTHASSGILGRVRLGFDWMNIRFEQVCLLLFCQHSLTMFSEWSKMQPYYSLVIKDGTKQHNAVHKQPQTRVPSLQQLLLVLSQLKGV